MEKKENIAGMSEYEEENNNQSETQGINWNWIWIILAVNILVAVAVYGGSSVHYNKKLKDNSEVHVRVMKEKNNAIENILKEKYQIECDFTAYKRSMVVEVPDKELVQDIADYIHFNYPIIPKVLYNEIAFQIALISENENVSPELVVGITQVESAFNPMAISSKNARGLMQVMPFWAKHFKLNKVCDLHNVEVGIHTGVKVFKVHVKEEGGDISEGLYKYVNRDRSYVDRVYNAMGQFVMFRSTHNEKENK